MIEPLVLAEAKDYLVSDSSERGYAIVDSQFLVESWGATEISEETLDRLSPINTLNLAAGRPDALIASPNPEAFETNTEEVLSPLLSAIEAKGFSGGRVNVSEAITQAHAHLDEVNLGYAAVPKSSVKPSHRRLASELNIGLVLVTEKGEVSVPQLPRAVGASMTPSTETIRYHARIGEDVPSKLSKNHPKNALGYSLAVAAGGDPDELCEEYVIKSVDDARRDAEALGLIVTRGTSTLTPTGRETVRTLSYCYEGTTGALETVSDYWGSGKRLIDVEPPMGVVARDAILKYPPTQELIAVLDKLAEEGSQTFRVDRVAKRLAQRRPEFAVDLFLSTDPETRREALREEEFRDEVFDEETNYHTNTLYQYKAVLYHTGILTSKGIDILADLDFESGAEEIDRDDPQQWILEDEMTTR